MRKVLFSLLFFPVLAFGETSDTAIIRTHLVAITKTDTPRTYQHIGQLNKTAEYIRTVFLHYSDSVFFQEYTVNGLVYKNVICSFGTEQEKRIIVGAHYDVCGNQEGADDNASGVVGLLELARLLKGKPLNHRIDLVAYTLEEPPYFRTENMGSYVHAKSLADADIPVYGMVSLEMIAYFKDEKGSQSYPIGMLSWFYGKKGNYITLVKKFGSGKFARKFSRAYVSTKSVRTKKFTAPKLVPGIDYSDHRNYWKFGFSALMLTDTSFYRNKNYHQKTDTLETLDIYRMGKVIDGVYHTLLCL
ncbi:MAG TPA: peptidase M28 [Bacteroidetes bacterium]|nr:peptidase M28 [Bacteroidota bacterium]